MKLIPALDLMGGKVVRLHQGESDSVKRYDSLGSPIEVACKWVEEGAEALHVIDLDSAFGCGDNLDYVREIADTLNVPIQLGGGIRTTDKARSLLDTGIYRIIVGSMAARSPESVYSLLDEYGVDRVAVALDYRKGLLAIDGWRENTGVTLMDAMKRHVDNGVGVFLVTSVERDGTLSGPDVDCLRQLTGDDARIIAAGGVCSLSDLHRLRESGVYAAVIGKALYEGCFTMREALQVMEVV